MSKRKKTKGTATGRSPYRKYDKRPFRYSAEYYAWNAAAKRGIDEREIAHTHDVWSRKWAAPGPALDVSRISPPRGRYINLAAA